MEFIHRQLSRAAAGLETLQIVKPKGGEVNLRFVSVTTGENVRFAKCYGYLLEQVSSTQNRIIGLYNQIAPNLIRGYTLFSGSRPWLDNWLLWLVLRTQNANEVIMYTIGYDVIPPPKPKGWW